MLALLLAALLLTACITTVGTPPPLGPESTWRYTPVSDLTRADDVCRWLMRGIPVGVRDTYPECMAVHGYTKETTP